ncbi:MAG: hypothetical protein AAF790_15800 [Planctomycetota bacterium]
MPLALFAGCGPYFRTPNWLHPGPAGPQRSDAILFDPYPLDDVGPDVVGSRPRGYQRPVPEVTRARLLRGQPTVVPPSPFAPQPSAAAPSPTLPQGVFLQPTP